MGKFDALLQRRFRASISPKLRPSCSYGRRRRGRLVFGQESNHSVGITSAGVLEERAYRQVHERIGVLRELRCHRESLIDVGAAGGHHEVERRGDGGASPERFSGLGEFMEHVVRTAGDMPTNDSGRGAVDHVPRGDPVVVFQVAGSEGSSLGGVERLTGLEVEDAEGCHPRLVGLVAEQQPDRVKRHVGMCLCDSEEIAHADADRLLVECETLAYQRELRLVPVGEQIPDDILGMVIGGHTSSKPRRRVVAVDHRDEGMVQGFTYAEGACEPCEASPPLIVGPVRQAVPYRRVEEGCLGTSGRVGRPHGHSKR